MISDTLSDAIAAIDDYLDDPIFADVYAGETLAKILLVRHQMEDVRAILDAPPGHEPRPQHRN